MIKCSLAAATLTLGLATVAYANLSMPKPTALGGQFETQPLPAAPRLDASRAYTENRALTPVTLSDADTTRSLVTAPAPRQIALPGADAPNQGYAAAAPRGERLSKTGPLPSAQEPVARESAARDPITREPARSEPPVSARRAPEPVQEAVAPSRRSRDAERATGIRKAKWSGGEGATWKTGRDAFGFSGLIGGCRIMGTAGPHGYKLDRAC